MFSQTLHLKLQRVIGAYVNTETTTGAVSTNILFSIGGAPFDCHTQHMGHQAQLATITLMMTVIRFILYPQW